MIAAAKQKIIGSLRIVKFISELKMKIKAVQEAKRAFIAANTPPVLIYQMGKVGSSTVYNSLIHAAIPNPVLHLHFLSEDIAKHKMTFKNAGIYPVYHLVLGEAVRKMLLEKPGFPCKIISLVRDPIAFVISDLFQNPYFSSDDVMSDNGAIDEAKATQYLDRELKKPKTFSYVDQWFDRELNRVFDIDVFAEPFPVDIGYCVYKKANVEVLVIRLEDLTQKGPKAIADFLNLEKHLVLEQRNVRNESRESSSYHRVLRRLRLNEVTCRTIYSSRFVKHFYNEEMISQAITKWTK